MLHASLSRRLGDHSGVSIVSLNGGVIKEMMVHGRATCAGDCMMFVDDNGNQGFGEVWFSLSWAVRSIVVSLPGLWSVRMRMWLDADLTLRRNLCEGSVRLAVAFFKW